MTSHFIVYLVNKRTNLFFIKFVFRFLLPLLTETFQQHSFLFTYTFIAPNLCKGRLLHFCIQLLLNLKTKIKNKYFRYNKQNKTLLSGQVILPLGLTALGQYHLPSGFINHNIAQKEVFYPVNTYFKMNDKYISIKTG